MRWFSMASLEAGVLSFDELALLAAKQTLVLDASNAESYIHRNIPSLWTAFRSRCDRQSKRGVFPVAKVVDESGRKFISTVYDVLQWKSKRWRRVSGRLAYRPHILRMVEDLTDREYEALCCLACKLRGGAKIHLTPAGNEGGIDFVALLGASGGQAGFSALSTFRVIGQVKKYNKRVPVGDVRDFNDTLADVRRLAPPIKNHLPKWFQDTHAPIVGCMVGHNGFQSGSESKAKTNGIMLLDSVDLAEALAFSPSLGNCESPDVVAPKLLMGLHEIKRSYSKSQDADDVPC